MDSTRVVTWSDIVKQNSTQEHNGKNISHKINDNISVSNMLRINKTSLVCYHYNETCNKSSSEELKQYRGIIYEASTNKIVCKTFGYTDDVQIDDENLGTVIGQNDIKVFDSPEGFHVRVFYYDSFWFVSTHKCINAYSSKWASQVSYGDIFDSAIHAIVSLESNNKEEESSSKEPINVFSRRSCESLATKKMISTLDKNYVYDFLVGNDEQNRLVCKAHKPPFVYLLGIFDKLGTFVSQSDDLYKVDVPKLVEFPDVSLANIKSYVTKLDYTKSQGILVISETGKLTKIFNPYYFHYMTIRGSAPSLILRYIELRKNKDAIEDLISVFPEHEEAIEEMRHTLDVEIPNTIMNIHNIRYKTHEYYHTDKTTHFILRNLHSVGASNVTVQMIKNELDRLSPNALYKIFKSLHSIQSIKEN